MHGDCFSEYQGSREIVDVVAVSQQQSHKEADAVFAAAHVSKFGERQALHETT